MTKPELSELDKLLEAARAGDAQAEEQFFAVLCQFVFNQVKSRIAKKQDAQDVTQEVLLTVVQKLQNVQAHQFPCWLCQTIRHKIGDYIRRYERHQRIFNPWSEVLLSLPDHVSSRPDVAYEVTEFESLLERLWPTLSPDQQQLLSLLLGGGSEKEIRQRLSGICCGTLYARIHRLRRKLERECQKVGYTSFHPCG